MRDRPQTMGEEIANSLSHGIGLGAALFALPLPVTKAIQYGDTLDIVGASIFAATLLLLYLISTLYHAWPNSKTKQVLLLLDYSAIYLFIAGTYTPFTLGVLRGIWGWTLFGLIWSLALLGLLLKVLGNINYPRLSLGLYLGMGWLILIAIRPLWLNMPLEGLLWLLAGGVAYTAGVIFFTTDHLRYRHFIWHLFVLTGSSCHFCAVFWYAAR